MKHLLLFTIVCSKCLLDWTGYTLAVLIVDQAYRQPAQMSCAGAVDVSSRAVKRVRSEVVIEFMRWRRPHSPCHRFRWLVRLRAGHRLLFA